jgi:hypothetical protein
MMAQLTRSPFNVSQWNVKLPVLQRGFSAILFGWTDDVPGPRLEIPRTTWEEMGEPMEIMVTVTREPNV